MFRGAAAIVGPPIGGLVYEATQSYFYSFMVSAAFFLISGIFSFIALVMLKKEIKSLEDYVKRPL
jgi:MFS family permease